MNIQAFVFNMNEEKEIWKPVVGYEGLYEVSNLGRVVALERVVNGLVRKRHFIKPSKNNTMLRVCFACNNKHKSFSLQRVVAMAFIPNPNKYGFVKHIDGNNNNNRVDNLMWCEKKGNLLTKRETYERRKKPIFGVGINDIPEYMRGKKVYLVWKSMLARCYSENFIKYNKTYEKCNVCEEWHRLSVFKEWFDKNYKDGFQLDKDLFGRGAKLYSPRTCCFIPQLLNNYLKNTKVSAIGNPKGVTKQCRLYIANFRHGGISTRKTFDNAKDAAIFYAEERAKFIVNMAERYFNEGLINKGIVMAVKKYVSEDIKKAMDL